MKDKTEDSRERKAGDEAARVEDDPQAAAEKSKSVDERVEGAGEDPRPDTMVAGAPAAYIPQMGVGVPSTATDEAGPGEAALEAERRGVRARGDIQRG
ncbi:hypothetical protein BH18CHL2_BH18CHL2_07010 [soil metagenome]